MKYRYYLTAIQCNRLYSNCMRNCDLGIDEIGVSVQISFITDKQPNNENIEKIKKLLESTKNEKKLESYYTNVKFISAEIVEKE